MSSTPNSLTSFPVPVPHHSPLAMQSVTPNGPAMASSLTVPHQPGATTPSGSTLLPPSPLLSSSSSHTGAPPSHLSLHNSAISSVSSLGSYTSRRNEIRDAWIDVEGEVPVLKKDDNSWIPIRFGMLATKDSGGKSSWKDGNGILLDSHFLWFEKETDPPGTTKPSHVIRPIPLEFLRLASFSDEPEVRKHPLSLSKRVGSGFRASPAKDTLFPFTIYHGAAKITRRYTLYTKTKTERNKWKVALESAVEARKSQQDPKMLYEPQGINGDFFKVAPRIQFNRGIHYTGRVVCSSSFSFQGEDYIAIGCSTGVYISRRAVEHSFQKVLEFHEPTSMVAIPEYNKLIVHCESALYSYSLELAIRVSQGEDASKASLDDSQERLSEEHEDVLFFKAGRVTGRTLIVYASKSSKKVTSRLFELTNPGQGAQTPAATTSYQPLGLIPIPEPEEPHDATFILDKVAVCTSKAVYLVEPTNQSVTNPTTTTELSYKAVPELSNSEHKPNAFQRLLTRTKASLRLGKNDKPKILELVGKASILGAVTRRSDTLVVYNDLGCFVGQDGKPAGDSYYIEWERKASAFAWSGSHLLLFSPGYIEVRDIDTGGLVCLEELYNLNLLRSGWAEWPRLVGSITSKEDDGGQSQKLVELVRSGN